jgi:hypothetical protein
MNNLTENLKSLSGFLAKLKIFPGAFRRVSTTIPVTSCEYQLNSISKERDKTVTAR